MSSREEPIPTLIIGVGNSVRSDDGVGISVARRIGKMDIKEVSVIEGVSDGTVLMEAWSDRERVYVIDAVTSGAEPGSVFRFDAIANSIPKEFFTNYSTHSFSVIESVELGRALGNLPMSLIIYGIEGKEFSSGVKLSPEVERAVNEVISRIIGEIQGVPKLDY